MPQNNKNMENKVIEKLAEYDFKSLREASEKTNIPYETLRIVANYLDDNKDGQERTNLGIRYGITLIFEDEKSNIPEDVGYHKTFIQNIVSTAFMIKKLKKLPFGL